LVKVIPTKNLFIGVCDDNFNSPFDGIIDEVKIYNKALTDEQITALYNEDTP